MLARTGFIIRPWCTANPEYPEDRNQAHPNSDIAAENGQWLLELLEQNESSFKRNFDFEVFKRDYATAGPLYRAPFLQAGEWEWARALLRPSGEPVKVLCCPEDVVCDAESKHADHELCPECTFPLCKKCGHTALRKNGFTIPMGLANDNVYGYASPVIEKYKPRWIEMAAASPYWTTLVMYYVDGDRGHVMGEEAAMQSDRWAVRGNVFSFHMPWEDILEKINEIIDDKDIQLPHDPQTLAQLVKINVRNARLEWIKHIEHLKLRPHVVLALLHDLIDRGHPAFKNKLRPQLLKERFRRLIDESYPDREKDLPEAERQGCIPEEIVAAMDVALKNKDKESAIHDKNQTPAEGPKAPARVFEDVRPQAVWAEKSSHDVADGNTLRLQALKRFSDSKTLQVQVGTDFLDQWNEQCPAMAFPFALPYVVGGPDYGYDRQNERRTGGDAAEVNSFEYTTGMARRVELNVQNDWALVPALRNLWWRKAALNTPFLRGKSLIRPGLASEENAELLIEAAQSLEQRLQNGTYVAGGKKWPLNGGTTKLWFCNDLSDAEKILLHHLEHITSTLPGTQGVTNT